MVPHRHHKPDPDLERVATQARHYAQAMLRMNGQIVPMLIAVTPEGMMFAPVKGMGSVESKDLAATIARLLATAYRASAVALVIESWAVINRPGKVYDESVPPSLNPGREEVVLILAESREGDAPQMLFIQRDGAGKFAGLSAEGAPDMDGAQGRFTGILPNSLPTDEQAKLAKAMLKKLGVEPDNLGPNPMWN